AMKTRNQSSGTDFMLFSFFQCGRMNAFIFATIAILFLVAVLGNVILAHLISLDGRLHTPMHFLLSQLSLIDMMYSSTTVLKMPTNFLTNTKPIAFWGCEIQIFVFLSLGRSEAILLGFMSYDCYIAVCHPLHYQVLMSKKICCSLVICAWSSSAVNSLIYTLYVFQLPFCGSRVINNFFCKVSSLLPLVCQDTSQYEYGILLSGLIILLLPMLGSPLTYPRAGTVLQMGSGTGQSKPFCTCSSHLIVASLFYVTTLSPYMWPHSLHDPAHDKVVAVFYIIVKPLVNPFIYSLRNKEVLVVLRRLLDLW
ncbi:Olfactory receptor 2AK2, partial [Heterocephalus glaber]